MPMGTSTLNFDSLAQSFLNHCAIERGLSSNSIAAYRRDLTKFGQFLAGMDVELIEPETMSSFEISLRTVKLSPSSINRINSTLRGFFKHIQQEHGLPDPTIEIQTSRSRRHLPKALTVEQVLALIDCAFHEGSPITLRDQAMIEVLYGSGARVSELIGINVGDLSLVDSDGEVITTVKLRGKGGKERIVPLGVFATKAIDDYRTRIRPILASKNSSMPTSLFLNSRGGSIT